MKRNKEGVKEFEDQFNYLLCFLKKKTLIPSQPRK